MNILGIVAEYDPFHNGHLKHLLEARRRAEPCFAYVALSPCFCQRGSLSMLSPHARASCALEAGADAVFSLPVLWTLRAAEDYAFGAVSMLISLGITHLAFGAETDDLPLLTRIAELLENPGTAVRQRLAEALDGGKGYPAALAEAVSDVLPEAGPVLSRPNNTLAVCYLRALIRLGADVVPLLISRAGDYRDLRIDPENPSASSLRAALVRGNWAPALAALPEKSAEIVRRSFLSGEIPDPSVYDALVISRLRGMTAGEASSLPDAREGLEDLLVKEARRASTMEDLLYSCATKRYSRARLRRLCAMAVLHITGRDLPDASKEPREAWLLGLRNNPGMTARWRDLPIPVISSLKEIKDPLRYRADLECWRIRGQCCGLPDTLPFSEKMIAI